MKKLLVLVPMFLFIGTTSVIAQPPAGGNGQFREQQKQRLKDSLGLTDVQIDTVLAVQQEFMPKMRELRDMSEADRPAKMKELNDQMSKRLAIALKDEALANKISEFNARRRARGGNRSGGGGNN
ncbi:hypothetical protein EXU57_23845 [Segetibacter sp. 3557_3]|uniref:Spy/CpxP family protein refolding chaperone n=1 Tax=Segetibacter sp. 3557_3 TaxID=2547429 RepID=UPI001058A280|nr:Spy/CpxP family protein refolding chaperone [Segetibacter sp. 3557_3]TDH18290.1 hypothetical protein EXU57_23845 [Segetibacter sp. 3557_3]